MHGDYSRYAQLLKICMVIIVDMHMKGLICFCLNNKEGIITLMVCTGGGWSTEEWTG